MTTDPAPRVTNNSDDSVRQKDQLAVEPQSLEDPTNAADYLQGLMQRSPDPSSRLTGTPRVSDTSLRSMAQPIDCDGASWNMNIVDTQYSNVEVMSGMTGNESMTDGNLSKDIDETMVEDGENERTEEKEGAAKEHARTQTTDEDVPADDPQHTLDSVKLSSLSQMSDLMDAHSSSPAIAESLLPQTSTNASGATDLQSSADPDLRHSQFFSPERDSKRKPVGRLVENQHLDLIHVPTSVPLNFGPEARQPY
jgi:hypothetical protein